MSEARIEVDPANPAVWVWVGAAVPEIGESDLLGFHWALRALDCAIGRCHETRADAFGTWTAAVEGVWWATAADERLGRVIGQEPYLSARSNDADGRTTHGLRWVRHRHAHEITITGVGGPKKDFFGPTGFGPPFYVSPSNRWKTRVEVNANDDTSKAVDRAAYDDHIAGHPLEETLHGAYRWLVRVNDASRFPAAPEPEDPSVLG